MLNYRPGYGKQSRTCAQRCYYRSSWRCLFIVCTAFFHNSCLFFLFLTALPHNALRPLFCSASLACFAFQSTPNVVSARPVSHLQGACSWDRSPPPEHNVQGVTENDTVNLEGLLSHGAICHTGSLYCLLVYSVHILYPVSATCLCVCGRWIQVEFKWKTGHLLVCLSFLFLFSDLLTLVCLHV